MLAGAWRVLGDPARRAAYDRSLADDEQPTARVLVRRPPGSGRTGDITPLVRVPGPPLRAGPVRVESPRPALQADSWDEDVRLTLLAELALRYLAADRGRPW